MPYEMMSDHPDCSGVAVVKKGTQTMVPGGCHKTKADAEKHMAALYAKEPMMKSAPTDNLVRATTEPAAVRDTPTGRTLHGHFAVFNQWTEINSAYEGRFLERIAPGAFDRALASRDRVKVLYDHGKDPQLGNKPLGPIVDLRADDHGVYYEVELIRTAYNDDFIIPAAEAGLLGASFRFAVAHDDVIEPRKSTDQNPDRLPERTISDLDLYEFGPVTFPAYQGATAMVRCATDEFLESLANDPLFVARFTERVGLGVVERFLDSLPTASQRIGRILDAVSPTAQHDEGIEPVSQPVSTSDAADGPQPVLVDTSYAGRQKLRRQILTQSMGVGKGY